MLSNLTYKPNCAYIHIDKQVYMHVCYSLHLCLQACLQAIIRLRPVVKFNLLHLTCPCINILLLHHTASQVTFFLFLTSCLSLLRCFKNGVTDFPHMLPPTPWAMSKLRSTKQIDCHRLLCGFKLQFAILAAVLWLNFARIKDCQKQKAQLFFNLKRTSITVLHFLRRGVI